MKTKGTNWRGMKAYLNQHYSPEAIDRVAAALDEKSKEVFIKDTILPISWVDYSMYMKILLTADKVLGRGDFELIRQTNYFCAHHDIRGIYSVLVSLLSPKTVINALARLLNTYYDCGKLKVENLQSHSVTIIIEHVPDIPLHHDIEQGSYVAEVLRMAGAKNIELSHPKCMARMDRNCMFNIRWQ